MKKIIYSFNSVTIIFPYFVAIVVAGIYLFGWLGFHNPDHYLLLPIDSDKSLLYCAGLLLYVLFFALLKKVIDILSKKENSSGFVIKSCAFLLLITLISRFMLLIALKNGIIPFSDVERVWIIANSDDPDLTYYSLFPAYLNYSVFLKAIIAITGSNYISVIVTNILLCGITVIAVFLIAYNTIKNKKVANWSGIIYALMPSGITYALIGTPEFLTIAFNSWGLYFLLLSMKKMGKKKFAYAAIGGVLLGIGASYKAFAIIIIIAYSIAISFQEIHVITARKSNIKRGITSIVIVACMVMVVIVGYKTSNETILTITEKTYNVSLDYSTAVPHFLLVGLNTQGEGQIHIGDLSRQYVNRYFENGQNADEAKEYAVSLLKSDWRDNKEKLPALFVNKFIWAWQDDTRPVCYLEDNNLLFSKAKKASVYKTAEYVLLGLSQIYYIVVLAFAIIGIVRYTKKRGINYRMEVLLLAIFGFFCLMLLIEAQGRYKCLIMPYICIIAAVGLYSLLTKNRRARNG